MIVEVDVKDDMSRLKDVDVNHTVTSSRVVRWLVFLQMKVVRVKMQMNVPSFMRETSKRRVLVYVGIDIENRSTILPQVLGVIDPLVS